MKKNYHLIVLLALMWLPRAQAQVREEVRTMSMGANNAFILPLPDTDAKLAKKVWDEFVKQYGAKPEKVKKAEEYLADNVLVPLISEGNNTIDVYSRIEGAEKDATLVVWFDLGGAYLDGRTFPEKRNEAEKILLRYAIEVAREKTNIELDDQQKELKKMEGQQRKLEKDNEGYHKDIEDAKEKIRKAEQAIEQNLRDQEASKQRIQAQEKLIESIKKKLADLQ